MIRFFLKELTERIEILEMQMTELAKENKDEEMNEVAGFKGFGNMLMQSRLTDIENKYEQIKKRL